LFTPKSATRQISDCETWRPKRQVDDLLHHERLAAPAQREQFGELLRMWLLEVTAEDRAD
jgi:hypothetical protein